MILYQLQLALYDNIDDLQVRILAGIIDTKPQALADRLGITAGRLLHLLTRSVTELKALSDRDSKFTYYHQYFEHLVKDRGYDAVTNKDFIGIPKK